MKCSPGVGRVRHSPFVLTSRYGVWFVFPRVWRVWYVVVLRMTHAEGMSLHRGWVFSYIPYTSTSPSILSPSGKSEGLFLFCGVRGGFFLRGAGGAKKGKWKGFLPPLVFSFFRC